MTIRNDAAPVATWVGIDIAKHTHAVLVETPDGRHQRFQMNSTREGYQRLVDLLHSVPTPVCVAVEPTGDCHRTLAYRLLTEGFDVCLVSSVAGARYREALINSWDKNDPKGAAVILGLLKQGIPSAMSTRWSRATMGCRSCPKPTTRPVWPGHGCSMA